MLALKALTVGLPVLLNSVLTVSARLHPNLPPIAKVPLVELENQGPVTTRNGSELPPYNQTYYFDQLIDHNNPQLGTFKQRYWHTWEYYEPGGPIILNTPGEVNAAPYYVYLTNLTVNGLIAQENNGATIVLEHRFFGLSNPYPNLTSQSFEVLNIDQAIQDLVYFAKTVDLPMPGGDQVKPDQAPWILIGGSYSGALTGWTMVNQPGVFWAGYASSGVVEAILDFWQYFEPIRNYMPKNCSADVQAVIEHVDQVFTNGTDDEIAALKSNFGLGNVSHLDDVAGALRNNMWDWQSLSPSSRGGAFFEFCDALEVKDGQNASEDGWGLDNALEAWGSFWNDTYYEIQCGEKDAETCLGTYDTTQAIWTNTSLDQPERSWTWFVCNEVGFYQEAAPEGQPTLVSRLVQPAYDERQCSLYFPEAFGNSTPAANVNKTNSKYGGWNLQVDRLFIANGQRDPWRDATVSADGQNFQSTDRQPIVVSDGYHCSDLLQRNAVVDDTIQDVQTKALSYMKTWLGEWMAPSNSSTTSRDLQDRRISSRVVGKPVKL